MREVVDGILYDTDGAQFVTGYKKRRRRGGGGGRVETGTMYVMGAGGEKRIFLVERPATGEAFAEPVDAATARIVVDEWRTDGRITADSARMALATLDMVAPVPDAPSPPQPPVSLPASGGGDSSNSASNSDSDGDSDGGHSCKEGRE